MGGPYRQSAPSPGKWTLADEMKQLAEEEIKKRYEEAEQSVGKEFDTCLEEIRQAAMSGRMGTLYTVKYNHAEGQSLLIGRLIDLLKNEAFMVERDPGSFKDVRISWHHGNEKR